MLALAWRYGGSDPYRLFNSLDEGYRPLGDPAADPLPPASPGKVRSFVFACGLFAHEQEVEKANAIAGGAMTRRATG